MTQRPQNYHEFDECPAYTVPQWEGEGDNRKLLNDIDPYKWSGDNPPPVIGTKVKCYMNSLGFGHVVGYFAEYGWLGVRVKLNKNPKWRKEQLDGKNPPAHLFGVDLQPRKKV